MNEFYSEAASSREEKRRRPGGVAAFANQSPPGRCSQLESQRIRDEERPAGRRNRSTLEISRIEKVLYVDRCAGAEAANFPRHGDRRVEHPIIAGLKAAVE